LNAALRNTQPATRVRKSSGTGRFAERLLCADIVAKVENRMTQKISRKLILRLLYR
jgi:hypothetical protein